MNKPGQPSEALGSTVRTLQKAISKALKRRNQKDLFQNGDDLSDLHDLIEALVGWSESKIDEFVLGYDLRKKRSAVYGLSDVGRWVKYHRDDPQAVFDCMELVPPSDVVVYNRLPTIGAQKMVFKGEWTQRHKLVAIKRIREGSEVLDREAFTSRIADSIHPKILDTLVSTNVRSESFLLEQFLDETLHDEWRAGDVVTAANLLYDIADALSCLHGEYQYAHSDIKPDNIGIHPTTGVFLLMDFGKARPAAKFIEKGSPTGNLRTRAPELLLTNQNSDPLKSDIWSLGATVFNTVTGRFPLFPPGKYKSEETSIPDLRQRIEKKWDELVSVDANDLSDDFNELLMRCLKKDPATRIDATELKELCMERLGSYIKAPSDAFPGGLQRELELLIKFLPDDHRIEFFSKSKRQHIAKRLSELSNNSGVVEELASKASKLSSLYS